jgi:hypothetical protein
MPLSDHDITEVHEVYLSYEEGPNGTRLPTLWDPENGRKLHNAVRAVWIVGTLPDQIEVHTDEQLVSELLDGDDVFSHDRAEIARSQMGDR